MNSKIYRSHTGAYLGNADVDPQRYQEECANPEGHVRAADILDEEDIAALGIDRDLTIYALLH